jgi:hypothetical protein
VLSVLPVHPRDCPPAREQVPHRTRTVLATVNFGLTAYATLTVACVKALHCVSVPGTGPGSPRRLFIRGTVECHYQGWQAPIVVLGLLLCVLPLVVIYLAWWARQDTKPGSAPSHWRAGVRRALILPYQDRTYWWEGVLMLQRLVST